MYPVNPCWVISCQGQIDNYDLQLYRIQECIMSTLVGLFHTKISLTNMVSVVAPERVTNENANTDIR